MAAKKTRKRTFPKATCPVCKTEQAFKKHPQRCATCPALLYYQLEGGTRLYYARTEFTTGNKINPDTDQPEKVHWIQIYPALNDVGADGPLLLDKTEFLTDTDNNSGHIGVAEHIFDGFLSIERFKRLLENHLL